MWLDASTSTFIVRSTPSSSSSILNSLNTLTSPHHWRRCGNLASDGRCYFSERAERERLEAQSRREEVKRGYKIVAFGIFGGAISGGLDTLSSTTSSAYRRPSDHVVTKSPTMNPRPQDRLTMRIVLAVRSSIPTPPLLSRPERESGGEAAAPERFIQAPGLDEPIPA